MTSTYPFLQSGLTLVEVVTALAIVSVLGGIAVPQFFALHERWTVARAAHAMQSSLMLARTEAIKHGGKIGIYKIAAEKDAKKGCTNAQTNQEWGCGWLIYLDVNGNGSWNSSKDKLLQEVKLDGKVNVIHNSGGNHIKFDRYGKASGLNAKGFRFVPEQSGIASDAVMSLCMGSGGRIRIIAQEDCPK